MLKQHYIKTNKEGGLKCEAVRYSWS